MSAIVGPLETLRETIDTLIDHGRVDLLGLPLPEVARTVIREGLASAAIPLRDVRTGWTPDGAGVCVFGTIDLGDGAGATIAASLTPAAGTSLGYAVRVTLPVRTAWQPDRIALPFDVQVEAFELFSRPGVDFAMTIWAALDGASGEPIPVRLDLPGVDGEWAFQTVSGSQRQPLSRLADLAGYAAHAGAFPWALDTIGLGEMSLAFRPDAGLTHAAVTMIAAGDLPLLTGLSIRQVLARIAVDGPAGARTVDLHLAGVMSVDDVVVLLDAHRAATVEGTTWTFRGALTHVNLTELAGSVSRHFGVPLPLPGTLPDLVFDEVAVACTPGVSLTFSATAKGPWDFPRTGGGVQLTQASFELTHDARSSLAFRIDVRIAQADPSPSPVDGMHIDALAITFAHEAGRWTISGGLTADVLEARGVELEVDASTSDADTAIVIRQKGPAVPVLDIAGVVLKIADVRVTFASGDQAGAGDRRRAFDVSAEATLIARDRFTLDGRFAAGTATGITVSVRSQASPLAIPLPQGLFADGTRPSVSITSGSFGIEQKDGHWGLEGGATVVLDGLPGSVQAWLGGRPIPARLRVDGTGLTVSIRPDIPPLALPMSKAPLSGAALDPWLIGLSQVTVTMDVKGDVALRADPSVTLPVSLNRALFGTTRDGSDRAILRTGAPIRLELEIGVLDGAPGAGIGVLDIPFNAFDTDPTGQYWLCDLGAAGLVRIAIPRLRFTGGGFAVSGGFVEDEARPLTIPLAPLAQVLAARFPELAGVLPEGIRVLSSPKLLSGSEHLLAVLPQYLEAHFGGVLPDGKVPDTLSHALTAIARAEEGLPARLREYLDADPPRDVSFSIDLDASGSLTVSFQTHGAAETIASAEALSPARRPAMALIPALPNLVGIRLSRLEIGPVFGGSLIMVRVNAEIDLFDPVILAGSVAASESAALRTWLPAARQGHKTLIAHDLIVFVVYEGGVPVPVPLFYEKLGVDACGPAGLALATSVSFNPLTHNTLLSVFETLKDVYEFLSEPDFELPAEGGVRLDASIGETYLQLPRFLGGATWGSRDHDLAHVDLSRTCARVLNGLKFFSVTELLAGIPIEYRCGALGVAFGPLRFQAGWAVTTRQEFAGGLQWTSAATADHPIVDLPAAERPGLLALVPAPADAARDVGVVVLLAGDAAVGAAVRMTCRFGMVSTGRSGFTTAVSLSTDFVNGAGVRVAGRVAFDLTGSVPAGGFQGSGRLLVGGQEALVADAVLTPDECWFSGVATLPLPAIEVEGNTRVSISAERVTATGQARVGLFGVTSAAEQFTVDHDTFSLGATLDVLQSCKAVLELKSARIDSARAMTLGGSIEGISLMLVPAATEAARAAMVATLRAWVKWADAGYKKEQALSWWDATFNGEHTLATWETYYLVYSALAKSFDANPAGVASSVLNAMIGQLPAPVAAGIRAIRGTADGVLFTNVAVTVEQTPVLAAIQGDLTVSVSLSYAGRAYADLGPFPINVLAPNPIVSLAAQVVKAIFR